MVDKASNKIQRMFGAIAPWYDFLNHLLSFQQDRIWRRRVTQLGLRDTRPPRRILDLCTGTADLALQFARHTAPDDLIVGADFTENMLQRARQKAARRRIHSVFALAGADALRLPFRDNAFDIVTVAFGARNFEDLERGLREMARVTAENGRIIVLEFSRPRNRFFGAVYGFYFRHILPRIGRLFTGTGSYRYLRDSVMQFPEREAFRTVMQNCGIANVEMHPLTMGVSMIYSGVKQRRETAAAESTFEEQQIANG